MEIRLATVADLNACFAIDDSFETEYVWQMEERNTPNGITVNFHTARLPRSMRVTGVNSRDDLLNNYQRGGAVYVADDGVVRGFVDVMASPWNQVALIGNLAVTPFYRRKGLGTRLMRAALDWGRQQQLRTAVMDVSTKDYPAICFCQKQGFSFCGFNDQLYPNRDIALLFAVNLK